MQYKKYSSIKITNNKSRHHCAVHETDKSGGAVSPPPFHSPLLFIIEACSAMQCIRDKAIQSNQSPSVVTISNHINLISYIELGKLCLSKSKHTRGRDR